jgi:hypothetical protein
MTVTPLSFYSNSLDTRVVPNDSCPIYLPKISKWILAKGDKDLIKETISMLAKKNIIPFTEEQNAIFRQSRLIATKTVKYLGFAGYSIIVGLGVIGGLAGVRLAKIAGYPDDSIANDLIPFTISSFIGVGLGVASMLFTGTFPDQKSDAADAKERESLELKKQFNEVACKLVCLFWSKKRQKHEEAKKFAASIRENLPSIKAKLRHSIDIPNEDERIVNVLSTAVDYITSNASLKLLDSHIEIIVKIESLKKSSKSPPGIRFCEEDRLNTDSGIAS